MDATLSNIAKDIPSSNKDRIDEIFKNHPNEHDYVNILTLNYTSLLDRLIQLSDNSYYNSIRNNQMYIILSTLIHAHGTLDDSAILGVSDLDQLSEEFSEEYQEFLIKSQSLSSNRQNMDIRNSEVINKSHIIIIYGASLGLTDKYLWNQIANKSIEDNVPIIIYNYVDNFDAGNPIRLRRQYKNFEDRFINNCGIDMEHEKVLRENIITVIGKSIFELE